MRFQKGCPSWNKGKGKKKTIVCLQCKKKIHIPLWRDYKFCSIKCAGEFRKSSRIRKICKWCNKEFFVTLWEKRKLFCNEKCFWKSLKGKRLSEKHIKNMSNAHIGLTPWNKGKTGLPKHSEVTKRKMGKAHKGEKSNLWKGGITPLHIIIRTSFENKQWIRQVFERDNYTCQECFGRGIRLHAHHHIKPFAKIFQEFLQEYDQFSPIEDKETLFRLAIKYKPFWDTNNGQTLCEECHKQTSNYLVRR